MKENQHRAPKATLSNDHLDVRNSGEPVLLTDVQPLGGVSIEAARAGQQVRICTRLAISSDEPLFHRLVDDLNNVIQHMAQKAGATVNLRRSNAVLLVLRPDGSGELWVDSAAVSLLCRLKRSVKAGSPIFDSDIADVTEMNFPCVSIGKQDKVLVLFREGWSFGLAFDFNPRQELDLSTFSKSLGTLYRTLRYRHLYAAVNNPAVFDTLRTAGWFPFVEIISSEFLDLVTCAESGFDLADAAEKILAKFNPSRLNHLLERWSVKPHFAAKAVLLREAIDAFAARRPASVIKIVLTEIEGVLNDAYKSSHGGKGARLKTLLAFAQTSAEQRAGGSNTLFFSAAFGNYLATHTFANFDPVAQTGTAGSRHAVGHGAASQESYTMTRALQAILTLDQLAFYT